jgi:phosphonatase-like hydrolase
MLRNKGILVILNTGYDRKTAQSLLDKLDWKQGVEFDGLVTADDVANGRPMPDMIWLAMRQFNLEDPLELIKVGDSIIDIREGQNAGCRLNIGITTGAHTAHQLQSAKPDYIIHRLSELMPIVDQFI